MQDDRRQSHRPIGAGRIAQVIYLAKWCQAADYLAAWGGSWDK